MALPALMPLLYIMGGSYIVNDLLKQFWHNPSQRRSDERMQKMAFQMQSQMSKNQQKGMATAYKAMMAQATKNQNQALMMKKEDQNTAMQMMMLEKIMGDSPQEKMLPMYMAMMQGAPGPQRPGPYQPQTPASFSNVMRF